MESFLCDTPRDHHPPSGLWRLLYLGIDYRSEARSPKSLFLSGFGDVVIRNRGRRGEHDWKTNSYEGIDRYFRPMASSLRFGLNHSS